MGESGNCCRKGMLSHVAVARSWRTLFISAGICLVLLLAQQHTVHAAGFAATGNMVQDRKDHTATTLADGRVLITGGTSLIGSPLNSAEIYDPLTGNFTATGNMNSVRQYHTATKLADGRVLIVGGYSGSTYLATAEIFDPKGNVGIGTFTNTGSMTAADARAYHTATFISGTRVLIAGGQNSTVTHQTAVIFDPAGAGGAGAFTATGNMNLARKFHTATPISGGRVLFAGGRSSSSASAITNTAEIFDPAGNGGVGAFTPVVAPMISKRDTHTATLLSDGRVLIAGGYYSGNFLTAAEIFDPAGAGGAGAFTATAPMAGGHYSGIASRLPSGNVLIAGGYNSFANPAPSGITELFSPEAGGSFTSAGTMTSTRAHYAAVTLANGTILLTGGNDPYIISNSAEIYNPAAITVTPAFFTFEDTFETTSSTAQGFTISNTGSTALQLNSIALASPDFTLTLGTCAPPQALAAGGSCTVNVTFTPGTAGAKAAALSISSNDPEIPTLSVPLSGYALSLTPQPVTITVTFAGTGGGSISSQVTGLNCLSSPSVVCQAQVDFGTAVTLIPAGNSDSLFANWASTPVSASCSGNGNCVYTANTDAVLTATFDYIKPARIGSTFYDSLQNAYAGAVAGVGTVIQARAFTFTGPLVLDKNTGVTLKGGYDLNYSPIPADYSVVGGKLSISNGSVRVQRIIVR